VNELSKWTALTLRAGIVLGLALIVIGLAIGEDVLSLGLLVLIASPLAGVAVTTVCLLREKDRFWAGVALVLIVVVAAGILTSMAR